VQISAHLLPNLRFSSSSRRSQPIRALSDCSVGQTVAGRDAFLLFVVLRVLERSAILYVTVVCPQSFLCPSSSRCPSVFSLSFSSIPTQDFVPFHLRGTSGDFISETMFTEGVGTLVWIWRVPGWKIRLVDRGRIKMSYACDSRHARLTLRLAISSLLTTQN